MQEVLIKIFFIACFINLLYEILHSLLYKTCWEASLSRYVYLIIKAAVFDGFSIVVIYFVSFRFLRFDFRIFTFIIVSLFFAYFWEIYSLKKGKWEYSPKMPIILGVGLTPLIQLCLTGILSVVVLNYIS